MIEPFTPNRQLFPFTSRWLEHDVGPVHYVDEGAGDPILFLHGNPTWSFLFRGVIVRLRERFRCVAVDYPGFGLSSRPDDYDYTPAEHAGVVRDLVSHLDLRGLTVYGHDWGGPIGLRVAADEVTRVRALAMANTWYWPVDDWHLKAIGYALGSAPIQNLIRDRDVFVERLLPAGVSIPMAPEVIEHYRDAQPSPHARRGMAELARQILGGSAWLGDLEDDVRAHLTGLPLLLTWGVRDLAFPARYIGRFRDDFRHVTVRRLEARHFVTEDAPAEVAGALESFLGGDASETPAGPA
jgi:haloalkane dehalogenase